MLTCTIKHWREQRGLTQDMLAQRLGISQEILSRYETGALKSIPHERLWRLADELGVKVDQLFRDDAVHADAHVAEMRRAMT